MNSVQKIWENRYIIGGNSGAGSYGVLCDYKSKFINTFINDKNIKSMIEFGSGDGNQMEQFEIDNYIGLDISEYIINVCKQKYKDITNKNFITYDEYYKNSNKYDLAISLDVIYHLVEDVIYIKYMDDLFSSTNKFVIIYSTDWKEKYNGSHVYHRNFTKYIDVKFKNAKLIYHEPNKYPSLSTAEFYIYSINN
uniref:Methyltransferase type 11 domain-containing protein n=1 Tax=viral metagenome TaxID=1070528 RepID=A0A6C0KK69_9ZZZZ